MRALRFTVPLVLAAACGGDRPAAAPAPASPPVDDRLRPQPGAELGAPPPAPVPGKRRAGANGAQPIDLGADRPVEAVTLPAVGNGAAMVFTFGEGKRGWVARIPEEMQLPSVAYGDGRVYVSGGFESVSFYALDAGSGRRLWSSQELEDNGPTAPVFQDNRVIFNTESCTLFVMDAQTGRKIWHKYLGDPTLAQPAVADGLVFASHPADDGRGYGFSAFRIESGALVWSRWLNNELLGAPVIEGDSIYVSTLSGTVVRFRRADGKRLWSKGLAATSAPWVSGGELYLSRRDGKKEVQAVVSAETGELLRSHREMDGSYVWDVPGDLGDWKAVWAFEGSRPAVLGGVRYEAMGGVIQASDPTTGDAFWTRRYAAAEKSRSIGTVAVAGSQVVVASRKGELYGLDIDTGYTLWAYSIGRPVVAQPVVAKGWVYATTTDGRVIGLQVGDTTLDGWHMWGGNPGHNGLTPPAAEKHASRD